MKDQVDLTIIIPAYNEEKKIRNDIEAACDFLKKQKINGEIIVSTDGITDKTNSIVRSLKKEIPHLVLLAETERIGKGAAIKKAIAKAQGDLVLFADAGLCVPYDNALLGFKLIEKGADCAIGSRALAKSKIIKKQPLYRVIGSQIFKVIVHSLLGVPAVIKDTQCGFKIYKFDVAQHVFADLKTNKMMFDIEIILRLKKYKYVMKSFPVTWRSDDDTKFNPLSGSLDNLLDLVKIKTIYKL